MRRPIIAGNWKMNNTKAQTYALLNDLVPLVKDAEAEVVICVPYTSIWAAGDAIKGTTIHLGAENVHWAAKGAYTGEISAGMLKEEGEEYVIMRHSASRQEFEETDQTVKKRVKAALAHGLKTIICVGETLEEREGGKVEEVLVRQTTEAFKDIDKDEHKNIVIAYEPVWAIGTGKTATAQDANDTIAIIRGTIAKLYCEKCADGIRIQYGGSMNPKNAKELMAMPQIDGGLIGGASLKAVDFSQVVKYNA